MTVAAEAFYGRKIVLRAFWDGEEAAFRRGPPRRFLRRGARPRPRPELPARGLLVGGPGAQRLLVHALPVVLPPDRHQRRRAGPSTPSISPIDYRELKTLDPAAPYFHAQYRQEMPCAPGKDYVLLDAVGRGHYVGCNLSVLQRSPGWWGEGDDKITVDGDAEPTLHGTGTEDYFSDAWGLRQGGNLFYGCPLQEEDFQVGSKATAYRFHVPDPVPFSKSIRVAFEHGHANDRADYYSSVAYWYQAEPHDPFPELPAVDKRLPFALESMENFVLPRWRGRPGRRPIRLRGRGSRPPDRRAPARRRAHVLLRPAGNAIPGRHDGGRRQKGRGRSWTFPSGPRSSTTSTCTSSGGPPSGTSASFCRRDRKARASTLEEAGTFSGYAEQRQMGVVSLKGVLLREGENRIILEVSGRDPRSGGIGPQLHGRRARGLGPALRRRLGRRRSVRRPRHGVARRRLSAGEAGRPLREIRGQERADDRLEDRPGGSVRATSGWTGSSSRPKRPSPTPWPMSRSPSDRTARMLVGSDDGVRIWVNGEIVHSNPVFRGAAPDQDDVPVSLRKGWNKVLVKVLQGGGGWGFYLRFADPMNELAFGLGSGGQEGMRVGA